ncbi:MAG: glycosyltransferase family 39 protein, partial [Dehalococcoidia bacterium]
MTQRLSAALRRKELLPLLLLFVVVAAFAVRTSGVDWDGGSLYHPDERSIYMRAACMYDTLTEQSGWQGCADPAFPQDTPGIPSPGTLFDAEASPLNPHWFPIGSILIYLLVGVRGVLGLFMESVSLQDLAVAGRLMAALADTGSVMLLYLVGRRLFGAGAGLLAAALYAFSAMYIQLATYYRPEPFVVLLALATFWFVLNILERDSLRDHAWLGVMVGLSLALRASSAPLLAPVALAYGVLTWRWWQAQRELMPEGGMASALPALVPNWALGVGIKAVLAGAAALAAFAVSQPYAFIDFQQYWRDLTWELDKTAGSVPYTVQYIGIPRNGVYEVTQSAVWGLGLPLGIAAWSGLALTIGRMFRRPRLADALVLALVVPSLLVVMSYEVKFLRYLVMVLPFMVLLG